MGGVDQSDMMLYAYLDECKTLKFWKKLFSLIGRMAVNAYILYLQNTADRKLNQDFIQIFYMSSYHINSLSVMIKPW